jgi:hypothetical protein
MKIKLLLTAAAALCFVVGAGLAVTSVSVAQNASTLRSVDEFNSIADEQARSLALFEEAGRVIQHPRCVNCHPATDRPLQGLTMHPHQPPVFRGDAGMGAVGMQCSTCHGMENIKVVGQADTLKSIPGNPKWHLAPIEMAWEGKTLGQICEQIKDKARNGNMTMEQLIHHMAQDELVGWGWNPGEGREPVPGTQEEFGKIFKAWADTGAVCPKA